MASDPTPDPVRSMPPDGGGSGGSTGVASPGLGVEGQRILVGGTEVRALEQAKPATIEITFRNYSEQRVAGAVARLTDAPGARVTNREVVLGDVTPQGTAVARYQVTLEPAECVEYFGAAGEVSADGPGEPSFFKVAFPVACPGANLLIEQVEIAGGDGDSAPEPGEVVTVLVTLHNSGADPATNVRGTMTLSNTEGAEVVTGEASWPDIAPGESARSLTPFTMRIAPDAKTQDGCSGIEPGIEIDPAPPASDQPAPAEDQPGSTEPGAAGDTPVSSDGNASSKPSESTIEPGLIDPVAPDGSEPAPTPPPQADQGIAFNALFEVTGSGERFGLEFSNEAYCAYAGGEGARDLPASAGDRNLATDSAGGSKRGSGPIVPAAIAALVVAATMLARRYALKNSAPPSL